MTISRSKTPKLKIVIDTREQRAWSFPSNMVTIAGRKALPAGDYALVGDHGFSVERKTLDDFVQTITLNFDRFKKELHRMRHFPARVVIVEGNIAEIYRGKYTRTSSITPAFVLSRTALLTYRGVSILFADNPTTAAGLCYLLLRQRSYDLERQRNQQEERNEP